MYRQMAHSVVEASADSLGVDPDLPLARLAVPRRTRVVPSEISGNTLISHVIMIYESRINNNAYYYAKE